MTTKFVPQTATTARASSRWVRGMPRLYATTPSLLACKPFSRVHCTKASSVVSNHFGSSSMMKWRPAGDIAIRTPASAWYWRS